MGQENDEEIKIKKIRPHNYCYQERRLIKLEAAAEMRDEKLERIENKIDGLANGTMSKIIQEQNEKLIQKIIDDKDMATSQLSSFGEYNQELKIKKWQLAIAVVSSGLLGYFVQLISG